MSSANTKFHAAWQSDAKIRAQTRAHGLHIVADIIEALDRTTAMGSVTFHIHAERTASAPIANNVTMFASTNLYNNPTAVVALMDMKDIFTDRVAVAFADNWLTRTVNAGYLSANVLSPPSSPINTSRSSQRRYPASAAHSSGAGRDRTSSPTLSSGSTVTSLTESAITRHAEEFMPSTPKQRSRRSVGQASLSTSHTSHDAQAQPFTTLPGPSLGGNTITHLPTLTLSSTVTLSSSTATLGGISAITGSRLSSDVEEFMGAINKGSNEDREALREIYHFTGRALWVNVVRVKFSLAEGTAKALVGLMMQTL
ncbi:hypothetical protein PILCRDRAFT_14527 [Piloderma croceum F 1598]|nr:hypothetical protein PILCRDRAFT_14527 [Piloderma croceum F 1598]